jgi:hypothetical protein
MANLNRIRKIMVSAAAKEASYGAGAAVDSLIRVDVENIPSPKHQIINDQDLLGGKEEPSDQEIIAKAYSLPFGQKRVRPHTLAFWGSYALGAVSTSTPVGATLARKHVITPKANDPAMPSFAAEALFKSGVQKKYPGGFFTDGTLRVNRGANRMVSLQSNILLSGNYTAGTGNVSEEAEAALNGGNSAAWIGSAYSGANDDDLDLTTSDLAATPTTITSGVRSLEWQFQNNPNEEDLYRLGSGLFFGAAERGERTQKVMLNYDYEDQTEIDRLEAQDQVALQFKIRGAQIETGFYWGANLIFPALKYANVQVGIDQGKLVNQVEMQVLEHATYGSVILVVFNKKAAYAA